MPEEPRIAEEIQRMRAEPLLRAEKVLITGSLVLGLVLLVVFVLLSRLFPAAT